MVEKEKFENLEKKCSECAAEFIEQLNLLPVFLNYYADVRKKWLEEIGISKKDIKKINKVVDEYAKRKVKLENKKEPQKRKEVIEIENEILKDMFEARLFKIDHSVSLLRTSQKLIEEMYPGAAIVKPQQVDELENLTLFKEHKKRFPMDFLVFDPKNKKIIGIEAVTANLKEDKK